MKLNHAVKLCLLLILVCFFSTTGFCASSYDRELIVQDKTRAMQVEGVFKELMAAYEDEDAQGFLDLVSDERFRQDYMTFTDALYSDFRNYEIRQVDYWIDRVVPDHVKQFLYVRWEKRYENLDDGQQLTTTGFSRFLFDEVDGDYLLIELAGNNLFGGSLQEWRDEVPQISGQEAVQSSADAVCDAQNLGLCDGANCSSNGGYWYDNSCHQAPYTPSPVCDPSHLSLCNEANCSSSGNGYWYNDTCNSTPQTQPDLVVRVVDMMFSSSDGTVYYEVENLGDADAAACQVEATYTEMSGAPASASDSVAPLAVGEVRSGSLYLPNYYYTGGGDATITIDSTNVVSETNETNNTDSF